MINAKITGFWNSAEFLYKRLNYDNNKDSLFSADGNYYIKFSQLEKYSDDGIETKIRTTNIDLMNLSKKSNELEATFTRYVKDFRHVECKRSDFLYFVNLTTSYAMKNKKEMVNRIHYTNGTIFYDMHNESRQVAKISKDGWEIIDNADCVFTNYDHQEAQIIPSMNGDARKALKYINVKDENEKMLMMVYIITCFVPHIEHVILELFGDQGSGKSKSNLYTNMIIDPTSLKDGLQLTYKDDDMMQNLYHHYYCYFDNISNISRQQSDILARGVTGLSHTKRKLYSDDGDISMRFKRCIGINGIHTVADSPDVLDRSMIVQLDRIGDNGIGERELDEMFEIDRADIIGGIFDVLVKTLAIIDTTNPKMPATVRMRDFGRWGYAIAEVMNYGGQNFLNAFVDRFDDRNATAIENSMIGNVVLSYLNSLNNNIWTGSPSDLLAFINEFMATHGIIRPRKFPDDSKTFAMELYRLKQNFTSMGIEITQLKRNKRGSVIMITNTMFEGIVREEVKIPIIKKV